MELLKRLLLFSNDFMNRTNLSEQEWMDIISYQTEWKALLPIGEKF